MNYYPHHIGDFNSATRHLTRVERSIYRDLIELYYDTEQPLIADFDKLCRLVIARSDEERTAVQQVLDEFFAESELGWAHARCDAEIAKYHGNKESKSAAGKASAAKRQQKQQQPLNECSTPVQQPLNECATNQNQEPITNNQNKEPPNPRKRGKAFDAAGIELPDWLSPEDWGNWVQDRKDRHKPITEQAAAQQLRKLDEYRVVGISPASVIAHSIASGYQGLFPPNQKIQGGNVLPLNRQEALEASNRAIAERLSRTM